MIGKRYIIALLASATAGMSFGQTLKEAQQLFLDGKYAEAKPVFQKLVKQAPSNANYNFWYGACCYETGSVDESIPYLEKSAQRKVVNAYLYLGKAYYSQYRFDEAAQNVEEHIALLLKKKSDTTDAEALLDRYRMAARMIRGVEKIAVIDSFVVDKQGFLSAYKLSKEIGEVKPTGEGGCTEFVNEMGDKMILARPEADGPTKLYSSVKLISDWSRPELLKGVNDTGTNLNYPFLNSDGITLYYAAQGDESLGGYDLFITRYDSDSDTYLKPDNMGFPFNSTFNDYMYVLDDFNGLGWFASDRYQPEGKVCVYVFVPNDSKVVYDYDTTDAGKLTEAASLRSIRTTWSDADKVRIAKQQLAKVLYDKGEKKQKQDFRFVVNDNRIYYTLADFRSKEASELFVSLAQKQKDLEQLTQSLADLRTQYQQGAPDRKEELTPGILDKEKRVEALYGEISQLESQVRNTELKALQGK